MGNHVGCFFFFMIIKTAIRPEPKNGDVKSHVRFAVIPHRIKDRYVWLGRYEVLYVYVVIKYNASLNGEAVEFIKGDWTRVDERPL